MPFGLDKTDDLVEVEAPAEAIRLVIDERHSIRCSTLTATITDKKASELNEQVYTISRVLA